MEQVRGIPGAVDVGLSEQDPKDELRIELKRGLASQLGISMADAAQTLRVAFAGVEVGDWVDPAGGCASWYLDKTGRNSTLWPWSTYAFMRRARFERDDYWVT
jgi:hypothetical protein